MIHQVGQNRVVISTGQSRVVVTLMSIILTIVLPYCARAHFGCEDLLVEPAASESGEHFTKRFSTAGKPSSTPKFRNPARLILTRFSGQENFHASRSQSWVHNGKTFKTGQARASFQANARDHESILAEQQDFSLGKMVETDYLTPSQANMFRRLGTQLAPGQLNFFEVVHDASREEIAQIYPDGAASRAGGSHTEKYDRRDSTAPVKTAALWSVAGQVWDVEHGYREVELAWEKEDARKNQKLDRKKYKFVWEAGRAAQDVPGEIAPLLAASALLNYVELLAHGGKLDDAYVMFHSFDEVNTRLYLRRHPGSLYPAGWDNPRDSLFLVPLKEFLQKYPPRSVSHHVARIIELSNGKLTDLDAIELMLTARLIRWNELDFKTAHLRQNSPIILHDPSVGGGHRLAFTISRFGLNQENGQKIFDYLAADLRPLMHSVNEKGKYQNAADSLLSGFTYDDMRGVEISNLDPILAMKEPDYVKMVLIAAFEAYVRDAATSISQIHGIPLSEAMNHAASGFAHQRLTFGITTSAPTIERHLKGLHPSRVLEQKATITARPPDEYLLREGPYKYRDARLYFFTFEQVWKLALENKSLYSSLVGSLRPGKWRAHYFLTQVDLF